MGQVPDQAGYRCGTTTMMTAEGFHVQNLDPREEALHEQQLARTRRTMGEPML